MLTLTEVHLSLPLALKGSSGCALKEGLVFHQLMWFRTGLNARNGVISGSSLSCGCSFVPRLGFLLVFQFYSL